MRIYLKLTTLLLALLGAPLASAGGIAVQVTDKDGKPLAHAVAYLLPNGKPATDGSGQVVKVDQVEKTFVPHVSVLQAGGSVNFPNFDNIRHHVYSFSPARKFEIPLYEGVPSDPVQFPEPGIVALGCNIHDWMSGYIVITESPWYAITGEDGSALLEGVPAGEYTMESWHETLRGKPEKTRQQVTVPATGTAKVQFQLKQKKVFSAFRGAASRSGGYR